MNQVCRKVPRGERDGEKTKKREKMAKKKRRRRSFFLFMSNYRNIHNDNSKEERIEFHLQCWSYRKQDHGENFVHWLEIFSNEKRIMVQICFIFFPVLNVVTLHFL